MSPPSYGDETADPEEPRMYGFDASQFDGSSDWEKLLQPGSPTGNQLLGMKMLQDNPYGWEMSEWGPLYELWAAESGWNHLARNPAPGSTAWGIPQMLGRYHSGNPERRWREDDLYATSPEEQIRRGMEYIATGNFGHRNYPFRTPTEALNFFREKGSH